MSKRVAPLVVLDSFAAACDGDDGAETTTAEAPSADLEQSADRPTADLSIREHREPWAVDRDGTSSQAGAWGSRLNQTTRRPVPNVIAIGIVLALLLVTSSPAAGHGTPPEIEVQALIQSATEPLRVNYQVTTTFIDEGDPAPADVTITATSDTGQTIEATAAETTPGVAIAEIVYPEAATWTVTVTAENDDGTTTVTFPENLPWPHYTSEAGIPKVKADTVNPGRAGLLLSPETVSPTTTPEGSAATTSTAPTLATDSSTPATSVDATPAVTRSVPAGELRDVALRLAHLASLALWILPVLAIFFQRPAKRALALSVAGLAATIITGIALSIWGAPIDAPGLFRWSELGARLFGTTYQAAFLAKLITAGIAAAATLRLTRHPAPATARVVLIAIAAAAVAVTIMTQAHLFTHL